MTDGTHVPFGVLANAWKETVRDAMADIAANTAAAKVPVKRGHPPPHRRPGRTETPVYRVENRPVDIGSVSVTADAPLLSARQEPHP